jgi:6-phosphogluconolactonase (cycloisomerase 2 family)
MDAIALKYSLLRNLIPGAFALALSACGGGGGGGGEDPIRIEYTGNTNPAVIAESNAVKLVRNIFIGQTIVGSSTESAGKTDTSLDTSIHANSITRFSSRLLQKLRHDIQLLPNIAAKSDGVLARTDLDETETCDNTDGLLHITGFIEDNGTGTLTLEYINCREGDEIADGTVIVEVTAFDFSFLIPTDADISFSLLTITSSTLNVSLDGSIHSEISFVAQTEKLTIDKLVARNNATGEMLMINNYTSIVEYDNIFLPSSYSETFIGRIYDSAQGYLDYKTIDPINFSAISQVYPDSGQLVLTGENSTHLRVSVLSDIEAQIELDLDGNSAYEISGILPWSIIAEAANDINDVDGDGMLDSWEAEHGLNNQSYVDFGEDGDKDGLTNYVEYISGTLPNDSDTDNDGMPDGWELDYGFIPTDSLDAIEDADGEGASNLDEYLAGTDPRDADSAPSDLSIKIEDLIDPVSVDTNFSYLLSVTNNGPGSASDIEVIVTLPVNVSFYSATGDRWNCTNINGIVTCTRGSLSADTLTAGATSTITIVTTAPPDKENLIVSAGVSSVIPDIILVNNDSSITTQLADPILTFVEAQIDDVNMLDGMNPYRSVTVSPDGQNIYTTRFPDDAISVFIRNATTGDLSFVEIQQDGVNGVDGLDGVNSAVVSGDGSHVYAVSGFDNALAVFERNVATGSLTFIESHKEGADGVTGLRYASTIAISPDGEHIYVTGASSDLISERWSVVVFSRDINTGTLTFVEVLRDGIDGVQIGWQPKASISPDGRHLYVATIHENLSSDGAISLFSRNASTGELSFIDAYVDGSNGISGIDSASSISVSPDGEHVYVTGLSGFSIGEGTLVSFSRDSFTGTLNFLGVQVNNVGGVFGLDYVSSVAVSPNGKYVYTTSPGENTLAVFDREVSTGLLTLVEVQTDDLSGADGLANAYSVCVSPDDNHVYVTGFHGDGNLGDKSVAVFSVTPRPVQ